MVNVFKKDRVELELLTDNDMLTMVENGIRGRMCNAVYRYAKANNKNLNENILSTYLEYLDANSLY